MSLDWLQEKLSEKCPLCGCNWFISPPVQIHNSTDVRCVNCEEVYTQGGLEEARLALREVEKK